MTGKNGKPKVRTVLEVLTPRKAEKYLANRAPNRPLAEKTARVLADAIISGEWKVNGETLKFNDLDQMEDGQHRCQAVVYANKPIETFVTRGLPPGVFETIDTGRRRSVGDIFSRQGETNATALAAAVGLLWRYYTGRIPNTDRYIRHPEALAILEKHPGLRECVDRLHGVRVPGLGPLLHPSLTIMLAYLFRQIDPDLEAVFFEKLGSGEGLAKNHPILALRNRLFENKAARTSLPRIYVMAITIKAWNHCREKRTVRYLRWRTEGKQPEPFPEIK